jgi:iron complex transport system permease protein
MTAKNWMINGALASLIVVASLLSLLAGRVWLPLGALAHALWSPGHDLASLIVWQLRVPRLLLALETGAVLGLSGAVLQGVTRNPLAEPGLLGVSAGAALGAVIAIYFGFATRFMSAGPIFGLLGALAASALTLGLGRGGGTITLILAGAAVTAFAGAAISLALNLSPSPYAAYEIMTWLMGSLADRSWAQVMLITPFLLVGTALLSLTTRSIDALGLGDLQAHSLGVDLRRLYLLCVLGTALAVGASTAVTGAIGFVGLIAPHLVRPLVGYQPSRVMLPAALAGALLLLAADIGTRLIRVGPEMKLGVFTSLIGTPFFFWLVVRLRKAGP